MSSSPQSANEAALSPQPYFLVGCVRSGTTLLRLLLGHHPQLTANEEFEFVAPFLAQAGVDAWPDQARFCREISERFDVKLAGLSPVVPAASFPALAKDLLQRLVRADGRCRIGATLHQGFEQMLRLWPEAKFIYLRRDPRDVARSCVDMGWHGNAYGAVPLWLACEESWRRLCAVVPADRRLLVRFEDLVVDAETVLRLICKFLEVPFDAAMLEIERDTTYSRPDPRVCSDWRTEAQPQEVREVEAALGMALTDAGYTRSGYAALRLTAWRRIWLAAVDRWGRARFAQRRYGSGLWLARAVTKRLCWFSLRVAVQRRWDAIAVRHLK